MTSPLGIPDPPALAESDIITVACRPVDVTGLPEVPGVDLDDIVTVLHTLTTCQRCGRECWIGPRQAIAYERHRERALRLCYWCIAVFMRQNAMHFDEEMQVVSMGGNGPEIPRRKLGKGKGK